MRLFSPSGLLFVSTNVVAQLLVILAAVEVIILFVSHILLFIYRKSYHFNFITLLLNSIFAGYVFAVGSVMYCLAYLGFDLNVSFWNRIAFLGMLYMRIVLISVTFERGIATFRSRDYEYSKLYLWISPCVIISTWITDIIFVNLYDYYNAPYWLTWSLGISIDCVSVLLLYLFFYNRSLFKVLTNSLSQRYQISENIRLTGYIVPISIVEMFVQKVGFFGFCVMDLYEERKTYDNPRLSVLFYLYTVKVYILLLGVGCIIILLKRHRPFFTIRGWCMMRKRKVIGGTSCHEEQDRGLSATEVRRFKIQEESRLYFTVLNNMWSR